ncbi:MAG TPA: hypothetical protein VGE41_04380 [Verrucomicrobiae bacterium]
MAKLTKLVPVLLLALLFIGCENTRIINLTPTTLPRNANGLYLIEMAIETDLKALREASVTPMVIVGFEKYPMKETLKMQHHRFEALVPISTDKSFIEYHFKVDYEYNKFGKPGKGSMRSPDYKLTIK